MKEIYNGPRESCPIYLTINKSIHIRGKIIFKYMSMQRGGERAQKVFPKAPLKIHINLIILEQIFRKQYF